MIIQHKKNKTDHYVTVEEWNKLDMLKMQGAYKVIDSSELITKNIKVSEIEVFQINLDDIPKKAKKKLKTKPIKEDGSNREDSD